MKIHYQHPDYETPQAYCRAMPNTVYIVDFVIKNVTCERCKRKIRIALGE